MVGSIYWNIPVYFRAEGYKVKFNFISFTEIVWGSIYNKIIILTADDIINTHALLDTMIGIVLKEMHISMTKINCC